MPYIHTLSARALIFEESNVRRWDSEIRQLSPATSIADCLGVILDSETVLRQPLLSWELPPRAETNLTYLKHYVTQTLYRDSALY